MHWTQAAGGSGREALLAHEGVIVVAWGQRPRPDWQYKLVFLQKIAPHTQSKT